MTLEKFEELLRTVIPEVHHWEAEKPELPYIVWHEHRKKRSHADNRPQQNFAVWRVQVDFYSRKKRDPIAGALEKLFYEYEIPCERIALWEHEEKLMRNIYELEVLTNG